MKDCTRPIIIESEVLILQEERFNRINVDVYETEFYSGKIKSYSSKDKASD